MHVQDDKLPKTRWNIAIVEELITGNDGFTRAAFIRTKGGRTCRPIVKLYPLEIRHETSDEDEEATATTSTGGMTRTLPTRDASTRAKENIRKWTTNN